MKTEVVLELDGSSQTLLRSGRAVAGHGMQRDVDWGSGASTHVRLGRDGAVMRLAMAAGGLRHLAKVASPEVSELLVKAPDVVFAMALRDVNKAASSKDLIAQVEQLCPRADASAAWKRSRVSFEGRPDVEIKGDGPKRRYTWTSASDEVIDALAGLVAPPDEASVAGDLDRGHRGPAPHALDPELEAPETSSDDWSLSNNDQPSHVAKGPQQVTEAGGQMGMGANAMSLNEAAELSRDSADEARLISELHRIGSGGAVPTDVEDLKASAERLGPALALVCAAILDEENSPQRAHALAKSLSAPLLAGRQLANLPNDVLTAAAKRLTGNEQIVLALVTRRTKLAEAPDPIALLGPDPAVTLLLRSLAGAKQGLESRTGANLDEYALVCRRFLARDSSRFLTPAQLLEVTAPLMSASDPDAASWFGELVRRSLENGGDPATALGPRERQEVARRLTPAPLGRDTARARLLKWIWAHDKGEARRPEWWRGAGFEALSDAASGPLAAALEDPTLVSTVVLPILNEALSSAPTRRHLFAILSAPRPLLQAVDSADVGDAIRRVLSGDDVARSWLTDVGQSDRLGSLENENTELQAKTQAMGDQLAAARRELSEAQERMRRLEQRLAQAGEDSGRARESQTRQAQIDALRSLAGLAAYATAAVVEGRDPSRISQRVQSLVARDGLTPIGAVGATVTFVPEEHELIGARDSPESPVNVVQIGYKMTEPNGESFILLKATVIPST
ncbi:nucleotide exchange factor GrpE [Terrabacter sp. Root85]|uniref:nucleotide exchange factor GrpE n=1 Tax=Terrabacter sp. Root85 TaxID=1736603 RepID=UPI00138F0B02|nr:nucleotide exchange factor GrpE [Terrabacter sp. Root85]